MHNGIGNIPTTLWKDNRIARVELVKNQIALQRLLLWEEREGSRADGLRWNRRRLTDEELNGLIEELGVKPEVTKL